MMMSIFQLYISCQEQATFQWDDDDINFSAISCQEQDTFQCDDDDVCSVLTRPACLVGYL
jgi:hypothetical protein